MNDKRRYHPSNVNITTFTPDIDDSMSNNQGVNFYSYQAQNRDNIPQIRPVQSPHFSQGFPENQRNVEIQPDYPQNTPISASMVENKLMQGIKKPSQIHVDSRFISHTSNDPFAIFKNTNVPDPIPNPYSNDTSPKEISEFPVINRQNNQEDPGNFPNMSQKTNSNMNSDGISNINPSTNNTDPSLIHRIPSINTIISIPSIPSEIPGMPMTIYPSQPKPLPISSLPSSTNNTSNQVNSNHINGTPKVPIFTEIVGLLPKSQNNIGNNSGANKTNPEYRSVPSRFSEMKNKNNYIPANIDRPSPGKGNLKPIQLSKGDKSTHKYTLGDLLEIKIKCLSEKPFNPEIYTDPDEATWIDDREFKLNFDRAKDFDEEHDKAIKEWKKDDIPKQVTNLFTKEISDDHLTTTTNKKKRDITLTTSNSPTVRNNFPPFRLKHTFDTTNTNEISGNDKMKELSGNDKMKELPGNDKMKELPGNDKMKELPGIPPNLTNHDKHQDIPQKYTIDSPSLPTEQSQNDDLKSQISSGHQHPTNSTQIPPKSVVSVPTSASEDNSNSDLKSKVLDAKNNITQTKSTQPMTINRFESLQSGHLITNMSKSPDNMVNINPINENPLNIKTTPPNINTNISGNIINIDSNISLPIGLANGGSIINIHGDTSNSIKALKDKNHMEQITVKPRILSKPTKQCYDYCQLLTNKFLLPTSVLKLKARNFIVDNNGVVQYPSQKYK